MDQGDNYQKVLDTASLAGHILLENGAEISRVEDIMARIAEHYGVDSGNFFVLSNGIFTTGTSKKLPKAGGQASSYANVEFIPIRSIRLSKVTAVNRLSYDVAAGKLTLDETREALERIRDAEGPKALPLILASGFGAGGFCAVFGGGLLDCAAAFVVGLLVSVFALTVSGKYLSKIVAGISNALVATALCILLMRIGFGRSLSNIVIGAIMPLIPGVPFVNGVRDLANSDYIAGITRLTDAMLGFICITIGVSMAFLFDGWLFGGVIDLGGMTVSPQTYGLGWQALAAFVGTVAFAVLFGAYSQNCTMAGVVGALGWTVYLLMLRYAGVSPTIATLVAALLVCIASRYAAVPFRCPSTVFLLCGIFPLVPGAGIFWSTYYLVAGQFNLSLAAGFAAIKVAVAIVLGIIFGMELPQRMFPSGRKRG